MSSNVEIGVLKLLEATEVFLLDDENEEETIIDEIKNEYILKKVEEDEKQSHNYEDFETFYKQSRKKQSETSALKIVIPEKYFEKVSNLEKDHGNDPIKINLLLKEKLLLLKEQIQHLLKIIKAKYADNEKILKNVNAKANFRARSYENYGYYRCGAPYFKNALLEPAPHNSDYIRRMQLNELFPFHLSNQTNYWKLQHKMSLILGVKKQMIEHIISQRSLNLSKHTPRTRGRQDALKSLAVASDLKKMSMIDLSNNIKKQFPDFQIDWEKISFSDLKSSHSAIECRGIWNSYLRPELKRIEWTQSENDAMLDAILEFSCENWEEISKKLSGRSSLQCFIHFQVNFQRFYNTGEKWTKEEDDVLLSLVEKHSKCGQIDWNKIAAVFKIRNKAQCYHRYHFSLRNNLKKGSFSKEEDEIILEYVQRNGENFNKFPPHLLPNRTSVQIRNHYNNALKNKGMINVWTKEEDAKLIEHVNLNGINNDWKKIADILGTHSRIACRTRYNVIKRFLDRNPCATLDDIPVRRKGINKVELVKNGRVAEPAHPSFVLTQSTFLNGKVRSEQGRLFSTFMLAYNYPDNQRNLTGSDGSNINSFVIFKLLNVDQSYIKKKVDSAFTRNELNKIQCILNAESEVSDQLNAEMKKLATTRSVSFLFPPSYNSIIGIRGIALKKYFSEAENEMPVQQEVKQSQNREYLQQRELFRDRFFKLFYWTAMLMKLETTDLPQLEGTIEEEVEPGIEVYHEYSAIDFLMELHEARKIKQETELNIDDDFLGEPSSTGKRPAVIKTYGNCKRSKN